MINKKWLFLGIIILIIAIIAVFVFYFFNKQDLCKKINDEKLLNECVLCKQAYDAIDCKDRVYISYAMLKKDVSLCKNIIRDYNKEDCEVRVKISSSYRGGEPIYEPVGDSGGYKEIS